MDTNVIAYFLLGTRPFVEEASRFWHVLDGALAPAVWEAELANVIWMAVRADVIRAEEGRKRLSLAAKMGIQSVPSKTLWRGAFERAVQSGVAVYDTLFVELAKRENLPLATFDAKVLAAFPDIAVRPRVLAHQH
ncbi:MAG TPA: type II toxin-antitoxin system VapC family toxin [Polyangia bacterium]|nr:type II toxin-antitoxin system VapC family toxin [Polyangia bacterium]